MKKTAVTLVIIGQFAFLGAGHSEGVAVCEAENTALSSISSKYKPQFDQISNDGEKIGDEAKKKEALSVEMDVKFKEHHWVFDLPSVVLKEQDIILTLPQVTMKTNEMSFDVPVTKMVTMKTGQYPEFYCDKGFIPKCTVKWTNTYADLPEVTMETKKFSMDIPEIKMDETKIVMGIPEFFMERQDWYVQVPEFTLRKIEVAGVPIYNDYKEQGVKLEERAGDVKSSMKTELVSKTNSLFTCLRTDLAQKREAAMSQVQSALSGMQQSVENLKSNGIDPAAVSITVAGESKSLPLALVDMEAKIAAVAKQFADAAAQLDQNEKDAVAKLATG